MKFLLVSKEGRIFQAEGHQTWPPFPELRMAVNEGGYMERRVFKYIPPADKIDEIRLATPETVFVYEELV